MNQKQRTETEFQRRLRIELTAIVAERGAAQTARRAVCTRPAWRRRGPRLGLVLAAVGAVAILVLIVNASSGTTPPAFAVEAQAEGMVSVEIRNPEDPRGLEVALSEVGIPASVTYLPPATTCKEPRFQAAPWPQGARTIVVGPPEGNPRERRNATILGGPDGGSAVLQEPADGRGPVTFWISRAAIGPGQTLVITASVSAEGVFDVSTPTKVDLADGTVPPCEAVPLQSKSNGGGSDQ